MLRTKPILTTSGRDRPAAREQDLDYTNNHRLQQPQQQPQASRAPHDQRVSFHHHHHHHNRRRRTATPEEYISDEDEEEEEEEEHQRLVNENDWRQAAQMLTEQDELRLILGRDVTDAAPEARSSRPPSAARRRTRPLSPGHAGSSDKQRDRPRTGAKSPAGASKVIRSLRSPSSEGRQRLLLSEFAASTSPSLNDNYDDDDDDDSQPDGLGQEDRDDNSSISFAQSGCHSILSAWRARAANRAARLAARSQPRPQSVLSNASSAATRKSVASTALTLASRAGKSPAARTRIPLGPQTAQHFVTNSRRRRRANELILNTLEARRRALALNRQHLGSLFGSESYLLQDDAAANYPGPEQAIDYQRLSLSPSPQQQQHLQLRQTNLMRSKTPEQQPTKPLIRSTLSDLGGVKHLSSRRPPARPLAATKVASKRGPTRPAAQQKRPPLAKLDQNSSDLCSSNGSSSNDDDDSDSISSSDGSQFTQLVTAELSPQCIILDEQVGAVRSRPHGGLQAGANEPSSRRQVALPGQQKATAGVTTQLASYWQQLKRLPASQSNTSNNNKPSEPPPATNTPPKVPERTRKRASMRGDNVKSNELSSSSSPPPLLERKPNELFNDQRQQQQQQTPPQRQSSQRQDNEKNGSKLRRAALKRDSIRRLRLTRQQAASDTTNSSDNSNNGQGGSPQSSAKQQQQQQQQTANEMRQTTAPTARPLSKSRKLHIESNPFLNRHHFRTMSTRSSEDSSGGGGGGQRHSLGSMIMRPNDEANKTTTTTAAINQRASLRSYQRPASNADVQLEQENIRRVEQMLRQMKPNEVFASNTKTNESKLASMTSSASTSNLKQANRQRTEEQQPATFTRRKLINEGAKSSDDLMFDLTGNRRQLELDERWRHERVEPTKRPDGSTFTEDRFVRQRREVATTTTTTTSTNIDPPAEFADDQQPRQQQQKSSKASLPKQQRRLLDSNTISSTRAAADPTSSAQLGALRRAQSEERRATKPVVPARPAPRLQKTRPQSSGEQQVVPRVDAAVKVLQASLPKFEPTANDEFKKRVDQLRQMAKANLREAPPSSAASASSSSKQRSRLLPIGQVDQKQRSRLLLIGQVDQKQLTRPLSTNWDGLAKATTGDASQQARPALRGLERSKSSLESIPKSNSQNYLSKLSTTSTRQQPPVAITNLDEMLLADRYQRPLTMGSSSTSGWRRSNSSLGSLLSATPKAPGQQHQQQSQRPSSPFGIPKQWPSTGGGSVLSQSVLSTEPTREGGESAMRLLVREKSAPRLDYAQVQTSDEQPTSASSPEPVSMKTTTSRTTTTSVKTQQAARPAPIPRGPVQQGRPSAASPPPQQVRPMAAVQRTLSPRSPELFGAATTAGSSNDDSAIASSVSSPSLSFNHQVHPQTLAAVEARRRNNQLQQQQQQQQETLRTGLTSPIQSIKHQVSSQSGEVAAANANTAGGGRQRPINQASGGVASKSKDGQQSIATSAYAPATANLPSILRRQQHLSSLEVAKRTLAANESERQQLQQQQQHLPESAQSGQLAGNRPAFQATNPYRSTSSSGVGPLVGRQSPDHMDLVVITRQQQQQQQQPVSTDENSRKRVNNTSNAPTAATTTTTTTGSVDQQLHQQVANNPTKRVHFNDRTSIRSFESISSLNSNTTAVPLTSSANLLRQQIGSPDSIGSGSTSRLSGGADSPDSRRAGSGAAIYAIRGDPDLEAPFEQSQQVGRPPPPPPQMSNIIPRQQQHPQQQVVVPSLAYQQQLALRQQQQQQQTRPMLLQSQQQQAMMRQPIGVDMQGPPRPFIRMTAPPSMSSSQPQQVSPNQYVLRTASVQSGPVNVLPSHQAALLQRQQQQQQQQLLNRQMPAMAARPRQMMSSSGAAAGGAFQNGHEDDEDDPDYALRLRQAAAATNRVFHSYIGQQPQPQPGQMHSPGQQQRQQGRQPPPSGGGGGGAGPRRQPIPGELANFQTEV